MPERYLWSCDDQGNAYYLSSWEAGWRTLRVRNGHQLRVKRLVASSWCVWAISADQSPYLFVPSDGTVTRVTELISQHERWKPSSGFSASNLLSSDPPEYHQVGHESSSWTSLPSTRWQWESKNWEFVLHHSEGGAGWEYSTSFSPNASFSSFYRCGCVVRRRRWQRVRRFLGHDRWLLCCVCSNELESDAEQRNSPSGIVHVYQLAIGGEAIPYQPLGFLLLWAVTRDGRVIFRSDLRRDNPEGTKWVESCLLMVYQQNSKKARPQTHQPFAIDIHVNQHGHVLVLTDDNQIFHRVGVSWKNPYGTSWQLLTCESPPLQDHEHLVSVGLGRRSAWILANTGRCWFRADFNCGGLPSDPHRRWSAMAGRLKALSVSPTDQVFALDRLSNRLIYRSGITPATPGGEAWISLDLPILPGLNCVSEGPRSSFCPSQDEALQLVARLVQLTNPSSDDSFDENFEHCSIPEDIDVNAEALLPQAPPAHVLGRKLRRLFSSRSRTQTHGFFESFRHLLKDALDDRGDATRPVVDRAMPRIGHPPVNLAVLWAGAVSRPDATLPPELPHRWRVSALISEKKQLIPYFTIDDPLSPPDWYKQIGSALSEELPRVFEGSNSLPKVINSNEGSNQEPWTDSFAVDVLRLSPNPSTERRRVEWLRGQAVVTHTALENHHPEFLVTYPPPDSHCSVSDDWLETHSNDQTSEKLNGDEVAWAGYVGALSTLIPRTWKDAGAGGRRKFVEHVPFKKPGSVNLTDRGRRQSSPLNHAPPSSTGRLVAVFARRASSTSSVDSVTAAEATAEGGSVCGDAASARRHAVPRWILRFSSAAEASAWLKNTQKLTTLMPSTGKIWMVTEQAEVFWAASRNVETASWTKIGGHVVRVDSVSFRDGVGQVTWALGHDGTPWALREDWVSSSSTNPQPRFSNAHFPLHTTHFQTDCRQFKVYEFQVWRMLHGYTSSIATNGSGVVWSQDVQHQQPCTLFDTHLPPHGGRVHWLGDWEVDFSPAPTSASYRFSSCGCRCEDCASGSSASKESPPSSPRGSPCQDCTVKSSLGSLEVVITATTTTNDSPPPRQFTSGAPYPGTEEGFVYPGLPSCNSKGWRYTPRLPAHSCHGQRSRTSSGARHRQWIRLCYVCTEGPWQEVGALKLKSLALSRSPLDPDSSDLWAVTDSGELVFRRDVTASNPTGSRWIHCPINMRLECVATPPNGDRLWAICAEFGLIWTFDQPSPSRINPLQDAQWQCLGFSPSGASWDLLAPSSADYVWAVDVEGRLWVHLLSTQESDSTVMWISVAAPRLSDISCSPDGKVWAVIAASNTLVMRAGISPTCPIGTDWVCVFEGVASSVCVKGA